MEQTYSEEHGVEQTPFLVDPQNAGYTAGVSRTINSIAPTAALLLYGWFCVIALAFFAWQLLELRTIQGLQSGPRVAATVVDTDAVYRSRGSARYYVTYQFVARDASAKNQTYSKRASVSRYVYDNAPRGGTINVRYLAADPTVSRHEVALQPNTPLLLIGASLLVVAFLLWRLFDGIATRRFQARLAAESRLLKGEITQAEGHLVRHEERSRGSTHVTVTEEYTLTVHFRFLTPNGRTLISKFAIVRNDLRYESPPAPGETILVAYLDDEHFQVL